MTDEPFVPPSMPPLLTPRGRQIRWWITQTTGGTTAAIRARATRHGVKIRFELPNGLLTRGLIPWSKVADVVKVPKRPT